MNELDAIHFGAGNIGRGFIGEILAQNNFTITFVDVEEKLIEEMNRKKCYTIEIADVSSEQINVKGVEGINSATNSNDVISKFLTVTIVTTAVGPSVLPKIAKLISEGLKYRYIHSITEPLNIIACENMIGGTYYLYQEIESYLTESEIEFVKKYVGFPNAAVDRIVPAQSHEDNILTVSVEPFKEWVIEKNEIKGNVIKNLRDIHYVEDLKPYIERKLFTVNTGHATIAYVGHYLGHATISDALEDGKVEEMVIGVLDETSKLLIEKWSFDEQTHKEYVNKVINRFKNVLISDEIIRVGRSPLRKLGAQERFIKPLVELKERNLNHCYLIKLIAFVMLYRDLHDDESLFMSEIIEDNSLELAIRKITGLSDKDLISQISDEYRLLKNK